MGLWLSFYTLIFPIPLSPFPREGGKETENGYLRRRTPPQIPVFGFFSPPKTTKTEIILCPKSSL
jgi:hypothetical protein